MPVTCALEWAFVPAQPALEAELGRIRTAVDSTVVGDVVGMFASVQAVNVGGACGVIYDVPVAALGGEHLRLSTCDEPWTSGGPPLRTLVGIAFGIGTAVGVGMLLVRAVGIKSIAASQAHAAGRAS
jgi:hypothetical protein